MAKMLIYKYVSYSAGLKIIKKRSVGFTKPCDFNDPFEMEAAYPDVPLDLDQLTGSIFEGITRDAKKEMWRKSSGVLSLTRSPLNPLMWAHYTDQHKGFVVGLDATTNGLVSESLNLVPVQYGSVIYTESKPTYDFVTDPKAPVSPAAERSYRPDMLERLQRLYLYKPLYWAYEEEVRVVRRVGTGFDYGDMNTITVHGRDMHLLELPEGAIKQVYLGMRNPILEGQSQDVSLKEIRSLHPGVDVRQCSIDRTSWRLNSVEAREPSRVFRSNNTDP